ncbi:MAG: glucans biosynthesis glucosyltransferase MdoH [Burkholderiales bacterium]|nr:glucans biosynthesis glucosyltransferase MdoH [Burkholderiales bacterium]
MTPRPWFGLLRGVLFALWPGMRMPVPPHQAPWHGAARRRRGVLAALVAVMATLAAAVQWQALPPDAGVAAWLYSALLVLLFTWVGTGFATAATGAWVMWRGDGHALRLPEERRPIHREARTAVVMPVCNEDIATVFGGLRATCESLAATGALSLFDIYVLSDTSDPALRAAELRAWDELRRALGDAAVGEGGRIFYRWRQRRVQRKAGNLADFCRRWGRNYRYMVVLDADSTMHGDTLVELVRLMEAHPRAGIVQTLPQPCGHGTLHARAQQFANRVTGRLFSLGMAFWQLGDSHYWGHNAIIRVEPFMKHCALSRLPGRGGLAGEILSHDFVEAAMMSRGGYEVWLAPQLAGSWEQNPPHLLDELQRDRRWCQGNLQNARLVAEPGWRPVHRATFGTAAFSYVVAPLWLAFIGLGFAVAARHGSAGAAALWTLTLVLLLLPRVLAVLAVLARREQVQYGGTVRLVASALAELALSAMQAPLRMLAHSLFVLSALTGLKLDWRSPSRQADAVAWRDAWARVGRLVLPPALIVTLWMGLDLGGDGLGLAGAAGTQGWLLLMPLMLAVPLTVVSASPAVGRLAERAGLLWNPEARCPPRTLARAGEASEFARLAPPPPTPRPATVMAWSMGRPRALVAAGVVAFSVLGVMPSTGSAPELPAWLRTQQEMLALWRVTAPPLEPKVLQDTSRPQAVVMRERPARRIDNAVRQRARAAVRRALEMEAAAELAWPEG